MLEIEQYSLVLCGFTVGLAPLTHPDVDERPVLYASITWSATITRDQTTDLYVASYHETSTMEPAAGPTCGRGRLVANNTTTLDGWTNEDRETKRITQVDVMTANGLSSGGHVTGSYTSTFHDLLSDPPESSTTSGDYAFNFPSVIVDGTIKSWSGGTLNVSGEALGSGASTYSGSMLFGDPYNAESAAEAIIAAVTPASPVWAHGGGNVVASINVVLAADKTRIKSANGTRGRFRFAIPSEHVGNYFKMTYDVVFFPLPPPPPDEGEDPEDPEPPTVVVEDATITWAGPGDEEDATDDSWRTAWTLAPEMPGAGQLRLVNLRFECRRTAWGWKPQVDGEAYEPPEA